MADVANFPKSVQVDRPQQYQKTFFPFAAFTADDPNVTASPKLRLVSPWGPSYTLASYANNAAAKAGGLVAGDLYRTGADPDVVCVVH